MSFLFCCSICWCWEQRCWWCGRRGCCWCERRNLLLVLHLAPLSPSPRVDDPGQPPPRVPHLLLRPPVTPTSAPTSPEQGPRLRDHDGDAYQQSQYQQALEFVKMISSIHYPICGRKYPWRFASSQFLPSCDNLEMASFVICSDILHLASNNFCAHHGWSPLQLTSLAAMLLLTLRAVRWSIGGDEPILNMRRCSLDEYFYPDGRGTKLGVVTGITWLD